MIWGQAWGELGFGFQGLGRFVTFDFKGFLLNDLKFGV